MACIYCLTNKVNQKRYVGKTAGTAEARWKGHQYAAAKGATLLLSYAIRKHGADAFELSIVETCEITQLNERERYWIQCFDSYVSSGMGYNMTLGGDGASPGEANPFFGKTHTQTTRAHISAIHKGKPLSEAHKAAIGKACKGKINSQETRARMSRARDAVKKPILQLARDTNIIIRQFGSVTEAARTLRESGEWPHADKAPIRNTAMGRQAAAYGYCWKYASECAAHSTQ